MVTLNLDWREVLWWMQGGMAGSHNRWNVYDDMVNKVWPQCSEQERRNLWYVMRRDLGTYWRPDRWRGRDKDFDSTGDGPWKKPIPYEDPEWSNKDCIFDKTPWMYFRQVLARFDPCWAKLSHVRGVDWESDTTTVTVRTYKWKDANDKDAYFIDWRRRCDPDKITKTERMDIPDDGTM